MNTFLYNASGVLISNQIEKALPLVDAIKIRNRLLDGTYHVQSIGNHLTQMEIVCHTTELGKAMLDYCYVIDEPVRLVFYSRYYAGQLLEAPKWEKVVKGDSNRRRYTAAFTMIVSEEGQV